VNGENESMEEVDMDGSESDQELTGNETDERWLSNNFQYLFSTIGHTLSRIIHFASNVKKFVSNKTKSLFACFRPTVCTQLTSMLLVG
jgi:hypothetical protein